jgi:trehalose-6-phosphate synthase
MSPARRGLARFPSIWFEFQALGGSRRLSEFDTAVAVRRGTHPPPQNLKITMQESNAKSLTRISLRLVAPLMLSVALVSLIFAWYQVRTQERTMRRELERRSEALAQSLQDTVEADVAKPSVKGLQRTVDRMWHRDHIAGLAVFNPQGNPLATSSGLDPILRNRMAQSGLICSKEAGCHEFIESGADFFHVYAVPLQGDAGPLGSLVILSDASFIRAATRHLWRDSLLHAILQTLLIAFLALILVRWVFKDSIARIASWMRSLRIGGAGSVPSPEGDLFLAPVAHEAAQMAESLGAARAAANEEARLRDAGESTWTAERLRVHIRGKLEDSALFVVSNREPYMHVNSPNGIQVIIPASGVVTALEPVVVACDGTWIASGSGSADRDVVDAHDHLRVPPDNPCYTLRRVWLTKEEDDGYYSGFSNEGLWPLCHIAHTRPLFRPEDWIQYQRVNERFAKVVLEEMASTESPTVLVQDYHFALLPKLIKEQRPDARVAIFWHIPWPNPEAFQICPWQREVLEGLLGADLIGFHIQAHCNNFLATVDRALEARTDWERFTVNRQGHVTCVRPFPISVAYAEPKPDARLKATRAAARRDVLDQLGIDVRFLGVGVDRVDYTKGILERFRAIELFLDANPQYQGEFSFVQVGAPSRTNIKRYGDFLNEVREEAERINNKFRNARSRPIVLLERHHGHAEIDRYYRAADVCLVTSLHDGMNLVAKEFIASRDDERGALILSVFTGAARELPDALIVNPYDVEQVSAAIRTALEMPAEEQEARMARMRREVREHNIYRWAGNLMAALADIRLEKREKVEA